MEETITLDNLLKACYIKYMKTPKKKLKAFKSFRRTWGDVNPVQRVDNSKKKYNRAKNKKIDKDKEREKRKEEI